MHVLLQLQDYVRGVLLDPLLDYRFLRVQMILTARKSKDFSHGREDEFHDSLFVITRGASGLTR